MAFTAKTDYGTIVAAKLRSQVVYEELFGAAYKGDIAAAAVNIPVQDDATVADYNPSNLGANTVTYAGNKHILADINWDRFISQYLDGFDINAAGYGAKAAALEEVAKAIAKDINDKAIKTLLYGAQGKDKTNTAAFADTFRTGKTGSVKSNGAGDVYDTLSDLAADLTTAGVPMDGRYIVVNGTGLAEIMKSSKTIRQGDLAQSLVEKGFVAQIAGFNVKVSNAVTGNVTVGGASKAIWGVVGHPDFACAPEGFRAEPVLEGTQGNGNAVGGAFAKTRVAFTFEVIDPRAFGILAA